MADRHEDFRYLLFDFGPDDLFDAAVNEYGRLTGLAISPRRVALGNAVCSASFLALRLGVPPDLNCCGRTLDEDLRWIRTALARWNALS